MQFFDFIFLARRWRDDRQPLTAQLDRISADGVGDVDRPIWVNVWPEGTIVSEHERARSKAYADKVEIVRWLRHCLPLAFDLSSLIFSKPARSTQRMSSSRTRSASTRCSRTSHRCPTCR